MTDPVPPPGAKKRPKAADAPADEMPTAPKRVKTPAPASAPSAASTASPSGPPVPAAKPATATTPAPIEPHNVGKPLPKPVTQKDTPGSAPASAPAAGTVAPATPAPPAKAPAAPAPAAAKPTTSPSTPATPPSGDHAALAGAFQGTAFAMLEDGVGVTTVATDDLFSAASWAKGAGYRILSNLSAYDRGDHFGVLYCFLKPAATPEHFGELRLRVVMPKAAGEPACPSLEDLFPAAGWHEREMYDMYGVRFEGNTDLRRMFLPDGWTGHPMRKDYKEPEQFVALREGEDVVVKTNEEGSW